ncbi:GrpB family protein [Actinomycetospora atypica]|uniref:GrpB family protein n=1 Tax=Actinomycetospora atypica TaxID=1290095 RepID=A0ABV9YTY3_9PSEU
MSEEGLDLDLQRASATWPRPRRVALAAPDPSWPDEARRWTARLAGLPGLRGIEHVGATAVPDLPAVAQVDLLAVVDDPDDEALRTALEAREFDERGVGVWSRSARPDDVPCPTAVEVALLRPDDAAAEDRRRLRDLLRADPAAARRYTDVRRGLAGDYRDLAAYRAAKGPVIAALLRS